MPDATPPLTEAEIKSLREMMEYEARMRWLWSTVRIWVGYAAAIIGALYASWDYVIKAIHALIAK